MAVHVVWCDHFDGARLSIAVLDDGDAAEDLRLLQSTHRGSISVGLRLRSQASASIQSVVATFLVDAFDMDRF
jgi:hypothetical protein